MEQTNTTAINIASLNIARKVCCCEIVQTAKNANADFMVFQEPPFASAPHNTQYETYTTQQFKQQLQQECLQAGYAAYITKHTICLVQITLNARLHTKLPNLHQGRTQTFIFQLKPATFLHITGIYC